MNPPLAPVPDVRGKSEGPGRFDIATTATVAFRPFATADRQCLLHSTSGGPRLHIDRADGRGAVMPTTETFSLIAMPRVSAALARLEHALMHVSALAMLAVMLV